MAKAKTFPWLNKEVIKTVDVEGMRITFKNLSYGDSRRIQNECVSVGDDKQPKVDIGLMGTLQAVHSIVDWDLTDEEENKLPITLDTFDNLLDANFGEKIIEAVLGKIDEKVDTKKKKK